MMNEAEFYDTLRHSLWVGGLIAAPTLTVALVAGLAIGLFQALTSIQELTLTFVPKLLAIVAVFWVSMDFMTASLVALFQNQLIPLIVGG